MSKTYSSNNRTITVYVGIWTLILTIIPGFAFALDIGGVLKGLRAIDHSERLAALSSSELAACYSSEGDEKNCPTTPEEYEQLTKAVITLIGDPDAHIRKVAAGYLLHSTEAEALKPLGALLRDPDSETRNIAAKFFGHSRTKDPQTVNTLEWLLNDSDKAVRANAAMALGLSGTKRSLALVSEALRRERDPEMREVLTQTAKELEQNLKARPKRDRQNN